jgi:glycerophosphoryl diester phosphodiesterase
VLRGRAARLTARIVPIAPRPEGPPLRTILLTVCAVAATLLPGAATASAHSDHPAVPLIIGHRGAAGYRPEHTAGGYRVAAEMGADYVEPDLVPTKDGYLVDQHEPNITHTTDVAQHPEFATLKTTKTIDGKTQTGWFTTDFTLAQLKTLRVKERIPKLRPKNTRYNGRYRIRTFQQDIDQVESLSARLHRKIGIVAELKHPTYLASIGLPMPHRVLDALRRNDLAGRHPKVPVILECFEVGSLQWLHQRTPVPLMQLTAAQGAPADLVAAGDPRTYADLTKPAGLRQIAKYATYLGPNKDEVIPRNASGHLRRPTSLVADAHHAGLLVTPYVFRRENAFLPTEYQRGTNPAGYGDAVGEDRRFFSAGVDGIFTDDPDIAVKARRRWLASARPG